MAIPHLNLIIVNKSEKHTITGGAAYRAAEMIHSDLEKKTHDYTRKKGVMHKEILAPENAPEWVFERSKLWNAVEAVEKRKDARYARSFTIALPRELSFEQNKSLIREYIAENFVKWGMIADLTIHESKATDGGKNPHAHILVSLRDINKDGFGKRNRSWDDKAFIYRWREGWQEHANRHLEKAGRSERIDMRSYEAQGRDQEPTQHMGKDAHQAEEKGEETLVGDHNRAVVHRNELRKIAKFHREQDELTLWEEMELFEEANHNLDNLRDAASSMSDQDGQQRHLQQVADGLQSSSEGSRPHGEGAESTEDLALLEARRIHQEALQDIYRTRRHVSQETVRTAIRTRVKQWAEKVATKGKDVFGRFANLWTSNREAHSQLQKEKDKGYER